MAMFNRDETGSHGLGSLRSMMAPLAMQVVFVSAFACSQAVRLASVNNGATTMAWSPPIVFLSLYGSRRYGPDDVPLMIDAAFVQCRSRRLGA